MRIPIFQINYGGKDIVAYCSTLGGPASAGLMEEMISKGCEKFVFFGSCGVLNREISAKSLVIPTAAYRDKEQAIIICRQAIMLRLRQSQKLSAILTELKLPHVLGKTWTTDAFYRETRGNAEKRKNEGCITVEMECASIMAVAQFRYIQAYQFLYAANSLDSAEWDTRTLGSLPQDAREKFLRIALKIAVGASLSYSVPQAVTRAFFLPAKSPPPAAEPDPPPRIARRLFPEAMAVDHPSDR